MYSETRDTKDGDFWEQNYRDPWFLREPDFDKADFEAYCTIMDTIMKPTKERICTPSFVPVLLRFKP